jgi:uncharacterized protein YegP (UPF0339 family)
MRSGHVHPVVRLYRYLRRAVAGGDFAVLAGGEVSVRPDEQASGLAGSRSRVDGRDMRFELYRTRARQPWRWRLRAKNGKVIACSGEAYFNRGDALSCIRRIQRLAADTEVIEKGSLPSTGKRRSLSDGTA